MSVSRGVLEVILAISSQESEMPSSSASAGRWISALSEPPIAERTVTVFSSASRVIIILGVIPFL